MTEQALQDAVVECARWYGWTAAHFRPARVGRGWGTAVQYDAAGFPDLVLCHPERGVIFAELKSERGRVSDAQREWLLRLEAAGAEVYLWSPKDWPDTITDRLRRKL